MNDDIKDLLLAELVVKYAKKEDEWIDIYITPLKRIDLTIVSDDSERYDAAQISEYVNQLLYESFPEEADEYCIGFLDIYMLRNQWSLLCIMPV